MRYQNFVCVTRYFLLNVVSHGTLSLSGMRDLHTFFLVQPLPIPHSCSQRSDSF